MFDTVISCRVLQHLHEQERAVGEMARVLKPGGEMALELYNFWNLKTTYKAIRQTPWLRRILNAPFRAVFNSMSPFDDWGLDHDLYNGWFQVKGWMRGFGLAQISGRGAGFGYHKYLFQPFFIDAQWLKRAPGSLKRYYQGCFDFEKRWFHLAWFRWTGEKFVIWGRKQG
ncbi:putative methyltransferase [Magnetofaba australis IT-1]|uniref:Putative methyltransferase n=1 Tax=Magnetofaba australis IT-1 TaxID=1434232 RepID=A0A1Y2K899_9PROT|nr:putative methyltransferase [Magnetofaba australis IT-1]